MHPRLCSSSHRRLFGCLLIRLSTTATAVAVGKNPSPPKPHFMVEFLITSCGFSPTEAAKASKYLSHLKSPQKPNSFLGFMRNHGFNDIQIKKIVSCNPRWLCFNVEKTLAPKFKSLQDVGFSRSQVIHLIISTPTVLNLHFHRTILPRIEFWQGLLGSRDHLMRVFKNKHACFFNSNLEKMVNPNLSVLRECGISDQRIAMVLRMNPKLIVQRPEALIALVERVEKELGVPRSSGMFLWALWSVYKVRKDKFDANRELMKSFGWSEADFLSAFRKAPVFLNISQKVLAKKMDFLVKEAGFKLSDVARYPILLMFSLERRLIPRHHVMNILKSKGLLSRELELISIIFCSEKAFMEKYIIPHKEKVPELQEMYMAGCDGRESAL